MKKPFKEFLQKLRILILEDAPEDVVLAERQIKMVAANYDLKVTTDREEFIRELLAFKPQLIISDYSLPDFNGLMALEIARTTSPDVPFIFLTGTLENEELAAQTILNGAQGFVLKANMYKLPDVIKACLDNYKIIFERKDSHKKINQDLQILTEEVSQLFEKLKHKKNLISPQNPIEVIEYSEMVTNLNAKLIQKQMLLEKKIQLTAPFTV